MISWGELDIQDTPEARDNPELQEIVWDDLQEVISRKHAQFAEAARLLRGGGKLMDADKPKVTSMRRLRLGRGGSSREEAPLLSAHKRGRTSSSTKKASRTRSDASPDIDARHLGRVGDSAAGQSTTTRGHAHMTTVISSNTKNEDASSTSSDISSDFGDLVEGIFRVRQRALRSTACTRYGTTEEGAHNGGDAPRY